MRTVATLATALMVVALDPSTAAQQPRVPRAPRVAITFDDLPVHSVLPPGVTRAGIATRTVEALRTRRAPPVYGFVNGKGIEETHGDSAPEGRRARNLRRAR